MIPRAYAVPFVLPVLFAAAVLAASAVNGRSARGPIVLTEREATLSPRSADRSVAEVWLGWTEPAGRSGEWLTRDALAALGFDVSVEAADARAESHYRRQLSRRAFAAFELNGPAWQAVLADRERLQRAGQPVPVEGLGGIGSRLVPVAVDRDAAVLALQYPDPRTHLITAATIRVVRFVVPDGAPYVGGTLVNIDPRRIQIPSAHASNLPRREQGEDPQRRPYTISLMYGSRWEPWAAAVN
jgi:hypothetical protein